MGNVEEGRVIVSFFFLSFLHIIKMGEIAQELPKTVGSLWCVYKKKTLKPNIKKKHKRGN